VRADDPVEVRLLAGFGLRRDTEWIHLRRPSARVVAVLALKGRLEREALASTLWPDAPFVRSQAYLRTALWRLNSAAVGLVATARDLLELRDGVEVDARTLLDWAMRTISGGDDVEDLTHPEHIGKDLLPSWEDPWLDEHREQLRVLIPEALEALALTQLRRGTAAASLWYALRAHQLDPLRESAVRILVECHLQQGNRAAAVRAVGQYRRLLRAELGVEPTPALTRLVEPTRGRVGQPPKTARHTR
jgi:DNA-binding SARP family transcriptional activator